MLVVAVQLEMMEVLSSSAPLPADPASAPAVVDVVDVVVVDFGLGQWSMLFQPSSMVFRQRASDGRYDPWAHRSARLGCNTSTETTSGRGRPRKRHKHNTTRKRVTRVNKRQQCQPKALSSTDDDDDEGDGIVASLSLSFIISLLFSISFSFFPLFFLSSHRLTSSTKRRVGCREKYQKKSPNGCTFSIGGKSALVVEVVEEVAAQ